MCSIIGCSSNEAIVPTLIDGLKRMEYRGYDSVGIASAYNDAIIVKKGVGKVNDVDQQQNLQLIAGNVGIGHTRWATHGRVNKENAHPHSCGNDSISVVHNGIIDNYLELRKELESCGYVFKSDTDTEVIPNLLSFYYEQSKDKKKTILQTIERLKGKYSFIALFQDQTLVAVKNFEPLILGIGNKEIFVSSDILGFIKKTNIVIYPENEQFVIIENGNYHFFDFEGVEIRHPIHSVSKKLYDAKKGEFPHFTIKEIFEQSKTTSIKNKAYENELEKFATIIKQRKNIYFTGSGTSYCAALVAKNLFSLIPNIMTESIPSSEVKYLGYRMIQDSSLVALSQSGESADALESVSIAKKNKMNILAIVNSITSSLARESDAFVGIRCGTEVGVAATKSFTSQIMTIYKIVQKLSNYKIKFHLDIIPESVSQILSNLESIKTVSKVLKNSNNVYVLGRGMHYPIAKEGALKIKEITYVHTEGLAAGELKHGPLALMDSSVFVIVINPDDDSYEDNLASISEIKARNAKIIGISNRPHESYDYWIKIPTLPDLLYPIVEVIPLQLLAYYTSVERGIDPDYPRNLAKSVTVK